MIGLHGTPLSRDGSVPAAFRWPSVSTDVVRRSRPPPQPSHPGIKVLHVVTRFIDGAGGNTLLSALGADPERHEVWVAGAPGGPLWKRAERHGIGTVKLPHLREVVSPLHDLIVLVELVRLLRRGRFNVVHTHSSKAGFLGRLAAWLARTPVVVHTIHGFSWHGFMGWPRRRFYVALERMVEPMTDAFLAVAPQVALEAVEMRIARPERIAVAPSAVELDRIPHETDIGVRAELGISAEERVVGTVGRLDYQKAPLDFVRMAALVVESYRDVRFVMVGEGNLASAARAEARRLGVDITFTGYRADAARIAASFDVYVVASLYEGLGRALTEAIASGRAVVATAVNGVVDLVEPGITGLLVPPADPEALARSVAWLLEHPEEGRRMGEAGRERARALFDPKVMCRVIDDTYARLLDRPTREPSRRRRSGLAVGG
jgi:glycosyltransferase involved in cell wall biosynthesis